MALKYKYEIGTYKFGFMDFSDSEGFKYVQLGDEYVVWGWAELLSVNEDNSTVTIKLPNGYIIDKPYIKDRIIEVDN